jgi:hypothetical protein
MTIRAAHHWLSEQYPDTIVFFRQVNGDLVTFDEDATRMWELHKDHPFWRNLDQGYWHCQPEAWENSLKRITEAGYDVHITTFPGS